MLAFQRSLFPKPGVVLGCPGMVEESLGSMDRIEGRASVCWLWRYLAWVVLQQIAYYRSFNSYKYSPLM